MRKLVVAAIAAATLITGTAAANAHTYFRYKPHGTYRVHVNPVVLNRLALATRRLAFATYQFRQRMHHRQLRAPVHVRWARSPLLARKSG